MNFIAQLFEFLRKIQRVVWGFSTLTLNANVFSGVWVLTPGVMENTFWLINLLVLGFLFGEETIKNLMPLYKEIVLARQPRSENGSS